MLKCFHLSNGLTDGETERTCLEDKSNCCCCFFVSFLLRRETEREMMKEGDRGLELELENFILQEL